MLLKSEQRWIRLVDSRPSLRVVRPSRTRAPILARAIDPPAPSLPTFSEDEDRFLSQPSTSGRTAESPVSVSAPAPEQKRPRVDSKTLLRDIARFLGPAALIPMSEPLQNLIETWFIANFSSNKLLEMACLGPSSVITSFNMYAFASLSVAVLIACSRCLKDDDTARGSELLSSAQALALGIGSLVASGVFLSAESILGALGVSAALLEPTAAYLRARILGFPIQIFNSVTVSGLLAQKSVIPALLAVLASLLTMGAVQGVLTAHLGLGLRGSAAAIVVGQSALALFLSLALRRQQKLLPNLLKAKMSNVVTLAKALGLLAVVYVLKNFSYIVMQSAAAAFPPLQAAAHQALWSFWNFTAFIMTSSEQAFYAYIPAAQAPEEEFAILQLLVRIAIGVGALASSLCATFGLWGVRYMTPEASLYPLVAQMTPFAVLALVGCCLDVMGTGMLLAKDRVARVVLNFAIVFATTASFVTAGKALGWGMYTVWGGVALFFMLRGLLAFPQMLQMFYLPLRRRVAQGAGAALEEGPGKRDAAPDSRAQMT